MTSASSNTLDGDYCRECLNLTGHNNSSAPGEYTAGLGLGRNRWSSTCVLLGRMLCTLPSMQYAKRRCASQWTGWGGMSTRSRDV